MKNRNRRSKYLRPPARPSAGGSDRGLAAAAILVLLIVFGRRASRLLVSSRSAADIERCVMQNPATTLSTAPIGDVRVPATAPSPWRTEDWIAVLLGFLVIAAVLILFQWKVVDLRNVVPSFRWTTDSQLASLTPGWIDALDSIAREAETKRHQNVVALGSALKTALASQDRKAIEVAAGKMAALGSRTVAGALGARFAGMPLQSRKTGCSRATI